MQNRYRWSLLILFEQNRVEFKVNEAKNSQAFNRLRFPSATSSRYDFFIFKN
jgi:hypothetical protein